MNGSNLKPLNGHSNGTAVVEHEEHDEEQYLNLIRQIIKKGE